MAERKKYNFGNVVRLLASVGNNSNDEHAAELVADKGMQEMSALMGEKNREKTQTLQEGEPDSLPMRQRLKQIETSTNAKAFNLKYVPREKLVFNKDNEYSMENIEKLGETILRFGLIHNLEVFYEEETDTYIIESGERRTRAIDGLIEKFKDADSHEMEEYKLYEMYVKQFADEGYPCNVKRQVAEELTEKEQLIAQIESKIRLRLANEEVRETNAVKTRNAIMELNELYGKLNSLLGRQDKMNVNEMLAKEMGMSSRQIKNYKATGRLIPELQELFENNSISLKEGANYAKLSEEEQKQIVALIWEGGDKKERKILGSVLRRHLSIRMGGRENGVRTDGNLKQIGSSGSQDV